MEGEIIEVLLHIYSLLNGFSTYYWPALPILPNIRKRSFVLTIAKPVLKIVKPAKPALLHGQVCYVIVYIINCIYVIDMIYISHSHLSFDTCVML